MAEQQEFFGTVKIQSFGEALSQAARYRSRETLKLSNIMNDRPE